MKKLISILAITLSFTNGAFSEPWPPAGETPEELTNFLEKTYDRPDNIKVGVTLFKSDWNKNAKSWDLPHLYGKITAIEKNKTVNGKKCEAFTLAKDKKSSWHCLEDLLNEPKDNNTYYIRFDDPILNNEKSSNTAENKDEYDDFSENKSTESIENKDKSDDFAEK